MEVYQEIQSNLIIFVLKFGFRAQEIITRPLFFFNPILLALERHPYPKLNELSLARVRTDTRIFSFWLLLDVALESFLTCGVLFIPGG